MITAEQVKRNYRRTNWGKLLLEMGYEPYHTESSAREVARYVARRISKLTKTLEAAEQHLDYCGYGDKWERECADASGLPKLIAKVLNKGEIS